MYLTGEPRVPWWTGTVLHHVCATPALIVGHGGIHGQVTEGGGTHEGVVGGSDQDVFDAREDAKENLPRHCGTIQR